MVTITRTTRCSPYPEAIAASLLDGSTDLGEQRVAFLIPGSFEYAAVQWGIWRAGGIAVPLSLSAADPELEHVITDAQVDRIIAPEDSLVKLKSLCDRLSTPLLSLDQVSSPQSVPLPQLEAERRAMILYTSGTTSKPKGVVSTHANIQAQITTLVEAWGWQSDRLDSAVSAASSHSRYRQCAELRVVVGGQGGLFRLLRCTGGSGACCR